MAYYDEIPTILKRHNVPNFPSPYEREKNGYLCKSPNSINNTLTLSKPAAMDFIGIPPSFNANIIPDTGATIWGKHAWYADTEDWEPELRQYVVHEHTTGGRWEFTKSNWSSEELSCVDTYFKGNRLRGLGYCVKENNSDNGLYGRNHWCNSYPCIKFSIRQKYPFTYSMPYWGTYSDEMTFMCDWDVGLYWDKNEDRAWWYVDNYHYEMYRVLVSYDYDGWFLEGNGHGYQHEPAGRYYSVADCIKSKYSIDGDNPEMELGDILKSSSTKKICFETQGNPLRFGEDGITMVGHNLEDYIAIKEEKSQSWYTGDPWKGYALEPFYRQPSENNWQVMALGGQPSFKIKAVYH